VTSILLPDRPSCSIKRGLFLLPRKEVIHPHLPVRIPCYDFVPIICQSHLRPRQSSDCRVLADFRGLTGGVYKTRERIHRSVADLRLLAIPASCRASCSPTIRTGMSLLRDLLPLATWQNPLYSPIVARVCSPGRKGHADLTSSPPSSLLPGAVSFRQIQLRQ
jgi:hypothetical protein